MQPSLFDIIHSPAYVHVISPHIVQGLQYMKKEENYITIGRQTAMHQA